MLKTTRTRLGSPAWLAVGLVFLLPALAEAQLFPNRTIRREKPNCATEPPFYKQVRRDYFGYYPTCWSRFPEGWGCPCPDPELQRLREELNTTNKPTINRNTPNGDPFTADDKDLDKPKPLEGDENKMPLPKGTSPFNMDTDPTPPPPTTPRGAGSIPGPATPPPSSMLDMPALPSTAPTTSTEPTGRSGGLALYPGDATLTSNTTSARPDLGPLPTAPTPVPYAPENGSTIVTTAPLTDSEPVLGTPKPAQAPKRRSLLGQLFGRNNTTTQNR